jgi:hypothetical protein
MMLGRPGPRVSCCQTQVALLQPELCRCPCVCVWCRHLLRVLDLQSNLLQGTLPPSVSMTTGLRWVCPSNLPVEVCQPSLKSTCRSVPAIPQIYL